MTNEGSLKPQVLAAKAVDPTESQLIEAVLHSPQYDHLNEWFDEQLAVLRDRFEAFRTPQSTKSR
jgi:hypothetical protein